MSRPELVEAHGYDTKFAGHLLRLLMQGIELVETGGYSLPMQDSALLLVTDVRAGRVPLAEVLELADAFTARLRALEENSSLPDRADPETVDRLLIEVRRTALAG